MIKPKKKRLTLQIKFFQLSCLLFATSLLTTACFNEASKNVLLENRDSKEPHISATTEPTASPAEDNETLVDLVEEEPADNQVEPSEPPVTTPKPQPSPSPSKPATDVEVEVILTKQQTAKKLSIDKIYEGKISSLRSECKATSGQLLESMISELSSNEDATLMTLQSKFLGKLIKAEASCDGSFQDLIDDAIADYQGADLPVSKLPAWKSQYNKEKSAVRSAALAKLVAAIK